MLLLLSTRFPFTSCVIANNKTFHIFVEDIANVVYRLSDGEHKMIEYSIPSVYLSSWWPEHFFLWPMFGFHNQYIKWSYIKDAY